MGVPIDPESPRTVVLVEDDPDHAELVARALEDDAPGIDGIEVCRRLRTDDEEMAAVRVVLLTTADPGRDEAVCRDPATSWVVNRRRQGLPAADRRPGSRGGPRGGGASLREAGRADP